MNPERWEKLTKREQLLNIGAEFMRAKVWQGKDKEKFLLALEISLELIDLTLGDPKWKNGILALSRLRDETAKFYAFERTDDIFFLYAVL